MKKIANKHGVVLFPTCKESLRVEPTVRKNLMVAQRIVIAEPDPTKVDLFGNTELVVIDDATREIIQKMTTEDLDTILTSAQVAMFKKGCRKFDIAIDKLNDLLKIQGQNGTWNYNGYMHGMYNGLACAKAVITDKDPEYKDAPEKFIAATTNKKAIMTPELNKELIELVQRLTDESGYKYHAEELQYKRSGFAGTDIYDIKFKNEQGQTEWGRAYFTGNDETSGIELPNGISVNGLAHVVNPPKQAKALDPEGFRHQYLKQHRQDIIDRVESDPDIYQVFIGQDKKWDYGFSKEEIQEIQEAFLYHMETCDLDEFAENFGYHGGIKEMMEKETITARTKKQSGLDYSEIIVLLEDWRGTFEEDEETKVLDDLISTLGKGGNLSDEDLVEIMFALSQSLTGEVIEFAPGTPREEMEKEINDLIKETIEQDTTEASLNKQAVKVDMKILETEEFLDYIIDVVDMFEDSTFVRVGITKSPGDDHYIDYSDVFVTDVESGKKWARERIKELQAQDEEDNYKNKHKSIKSKATIQKQAASGQAGKAEFVKKIDKSDYQHFTDVLNVLKSNMSREKKIDFIANRIRSVMDRMPDPGINHTNIEMVGGISWGDPQIDYDEIERFIDQWEEDQWDETDRNL